MFGLEMNDTQQCPSLARLKTHRAHGTICPICEPTEERRDRCPSCRVRVTVVGTVVQSHAARADGIVVRCPGSGTPIAVDEVREKPIRWRRAGARRAHPAGVRGVAS